jgi:hypothetical protein
MRIIFSILFSLFILSANAQSNTGVKTRFPGIWWQSKDTAAATSADSIVVLANRADQSLYWRWSNSGAWGKLSSQIGPGTLNYIPIFTGTNTIGNSKLSQSANIIFFDGSTNPTDAAIKVGYNRTDSGVGYLDIIGDAYWTNYGLRLQRGEIGTAGRNAKSFLIHKGTNSMNFETDGVNQFNFGFPTDYSLTLAQTTGKATVKGGVSAGDTIQTVNSVLRGKQLFAGGTLNWPTSTSANSAGRHIMNGDYGSGSQNGLIVWNENLDTSSKSFLWLSTKTGMGATYQGGTELRGGIENTTDGSGFLEIRTTNSSGASRERAYVGGLGSLQWGSRNYPSSSVGLNQGRMFLVGSSTPAYTAWNEATPSANNEAAVVLGSKTGQGSTTLGGAKIYGGIYNAYTYAGYARVSTTTTSGSELPALIVDSAQNTTSYGLINYVNNKGGLLTTNSVTPKSYVDSLIALKVNISDTASAFSGYQRSGNPVTVAAQPNITSLGTLNSLTVTNYVTAAGYKITGGGVSTATFTTDGGQISLSSSNIASTLVKRDASGNFNANNIAGSDAAFSTFTIGNWVQKITSNHIDYDYSGTNKYRFRTEGILQTKYGYEAYLDGSNTYTSGSYIGLNNTAGTQSMAWQLDGSNNLSLFNEGGTRLGYFDQSTGAYTALSDSTKKKDFERYIGSGLDVISRLKPTKYRMKSDSLGVTNKYLWFLAQEIKGVLPEAYVESDEFKGIDEKPIIATLVKAVQELKKENDNKQLQIDNLRYQLDELKAILTRNGIK